MDEPHGTIEAHRLGERAALYRRQNEDFARWASGYGVVHHSDLTQVRIFEAAELLLQRGVIGRLKQVFRCLEAADRIANAGMWLVVHMTYAKNVLLNGRPLRAAEFKATPEGHTGGSLNMVLAYVGYLAANAVSGVTRSWLMGQGHCVAAIDAVNAIVGNMTLEHAARYGLSDKGLTNLVRDFYSYAIRADGRPAAPLGSHVNPHTAGGMIEGGYLGFAELLYAHMPLPGERLVAFLSDGAFEEQRGSDWTPRWWRGADCGLIAPIMIANGRRIDQRTTMSQAGGVAWFRDHLRLNGFDAIDLDGRDPASYAWGILEMEDRLSMYGRAVAGGDAEYPIPLPHAIAEVPKGFGFPGAGTNLAHGLPLGANPATDSQARARFNGAARQLWVPLQELRRAVSAVNLHGKQGRPKERDHALARRRVAEVKLPEPPWRQTAKHRNESPMDGLDAYFSQILRANPQLRPRVGNPDEMRSNRMNATLDLLKHRVTAPEPGVAEAVDGSVITALNEEAVVCAALGNKGGINMAVSYEAFAVKMLGAIRQDLIFARGQREAGVEPGWLAVPVVVSSHTWENGKNEQSHQDPTLSEALLGEMSDSSRVVFPADWNTAVAALRAVYETRGQIWTLVVPKRPVADHFTGEQASRLVRDGALVLHAPRGDAQVLLVASGAYQFAEALKASERLRERDVAHALIYVLEPGRFRAPRDGREAAHTAAPELREALFPAVADKRVFMVHTRPEPYLGAVRPLDTGPSQTIALGYVNRGGTLDENGMLFANRCTWAHGLEAVAKVTGRDAGALLTKEELAAVRGEAEPAGVLFFPPGAAPARERRARGRRGGGRRA